MCGEVEVKLHAFLTLAPDEGEWSAFRSDRFNPGAGAGLNTVEKG
jgi:hypothetical protein